MIIYDLTELIINISLILFLILFNLTVISLFVLYLLYYFFPLVIIKVNDYLTTVKEIDNNG